MCRCYPFVDVRFGVTSERSNVQNSVAQPIVCLMQDKKRSDFSERSHDAINSGYGPARKRKWNYIGRFTKGRLLATVEFVFNGDNTVGTSRVLSLTSDH
jgi:hypothetical protein